MILYLSLEQVLELHSVLIAEFGGAREIRDRRGLEAALARPGMTFGGEDLYSDLAAKAAALMHSIVLNHPFLDGNKRVGSAAAELMVLLNQHLLNATDDELEEVTMKASRGEMDIEPLSIWFRQRISRGD